MNTNRDVISAFIDDEPFEPRALADALADPEGRAMLLDLIALRALVQPVTDAGVMPLVAASTGSRLRPSSTGWLAIAAALLLAIGAGYAAGHRTHADSTSASTVAVERDVPPAPTRTIALDWHQETNGGH